VFSAIYDADVAQLMTLGRTIFVEDNNKPAALLCFDHTFREMNRQSGISGSDVQILLRTAALCNYADLVQQILILHEPWAEQRVQKLFAFTVRSGRVCIPPGTFLHGLAGASQRSQSSNEDILMEVGPFYHLYRHSLRRRLSQKLQFHCSNSLSVRVFDPCEAAALGRCDRRECQRHHELDHAWFVKRLHFHIFQISLLCSLRFIDMDPGQQLHRCDIPLSIRCLR
jgi:hypothetical protein